MPDPRSSSTCKTYRISPIRQAIVPVIGVAFIAALLIGTFFDPASSRALVLTAGTVFLIFLPFSLLVRYTQLTISPHDVKLRQFGWALRAPWEDVAAICLDPGAQGLELRRPMRTWGAKLLAGATAVASVLIRFYPPEHQKLVHECRWIPLEPFDWWFRHGQLQQDIARCARWLFEEKR